MKLPDSVTRVRSYLGDAYGLDSRSLALFRMAVGIIGLYEIVTRFQLRVMFFTDSGVLPRRDALQTVSSSQWSLLFINGSEEFVTAFFIISMVAAVAFILGWKTQIASIVLWIAVFSIHARIQYLNNGGDVLLRATLFWAMFLPLGKVWSLDSRLKHPDAHQSKQVVLAPVVSIAGFALIVQQFVVYWFTATLKSDPQWKEEGTALYFALGARDYSNGFGNWVFHHAPDSLLRSFTYAALMLEYVAPLLLLLPVAFGAYRTAGVLMICALQVGIMSTMTVGLFPFISIAGVVGVLPKWFWESLLPRLSPSGLGVTALLGSKSQTLQLVGEISPASQGGHPDSALYFGGNIPRPNISSKLLINSFVTFALICMVWGNLAFVSAYQPPETVKHVTWVTGLRQQWNMFAPRPVQGSRWFITEGELASGKKIDVLVSLAESDHLLQVPSQWDQSEDIRVKSKIWRKYFGSIQDKDVRIENFARYSCRVWNDNNSGDGALVTITIARGYAKTLPNSERAEPVYDTWLSWNCN